MKVAQSKRNVMGLAMLVVVVVAVGYVVGVYRTEYRLRPYLWRGNSELQALATRYGSVRNSTYGEEWIVRDFFQDRRGGVFVDVGANHYQRDSNTYYLESQLGWSGLAIEPQTKFAADYRERRPLTTFVPLFVSDVSDREATLYVPSNDLIASFDKHFAEAESHSSVHPVSAQTMTLDDILDRHGIRDSRLPVDRHRTARTASTEGVLDRAVPATPGGRRVPRPGAATDPRLLCESWLRRRRQVSPRGRREPVVRTRWANWKRKLR